MRRVSVMYKYDILCAVQYFGRSLKSPWDRKKTIHDWNELTGVSAVLSMQYFWVSTVALLRLLGCPASPHRLLRSPLAKVDACSDLQRHVNCRLKISQAGIPPCQFYLPIRRLAVSVVTNALKKKKIPEAETTWMKAILTRQNVFCSNINWLYKMQTWKNTEPFKFKLVL